MIFRFMPFFKQIQGTQTPWINLLLAVCFISSIKSSPWNYNACSIVWTRKNLRTMCVPESNRSDMVSDEWQMWQIATHRQCSEKERRAALFLSKDGSFGQSCLGNISWKFWCWLVWTKLSSVHLYCRILEYSEYHFTLPGLGLVLGEYTNVNKTCIAVWDQSALSVFLQQWVMCNILHNF